MKLQKPNRASVFVHQAVTDKACPICQEEVGHRTPDDVKESWALTPCGHAFGNVCLKRYLAITERPLCPVCRQDVFHYCAHPILPVPYDPAKGVARAAYPWDGDPRSSMCPYCLAGRGSRVLVVQTPPAVKSWSVWGLPRRVAGAVGATLRFARILKQQQQPPEVIVIPGVETPRERMPVDRIPVPGPYGRWELASQEPDWKFLRWFDMQEPRTSAVADLMR
ncbi:hypothetical protein NKR23_g11861 [Pleurostoma richardsiae]|uniref:RING-type domain-containing protein n=1 Tax=Pleurostoma richardsiae TaxID=41990 RepID=A0AA38VD87_9PEZI|nr:hypothetical protein NKR23_g11861 [Pleurostoma richardsiae]